MSAADALRPVVRGAAGGGGPATKRPAPAQRTLPAGSAQGIGLWVFIGVATALFSLFLAAYVMRLSSDDATAIAMPPQLWLSTAWLVAGSLLLQWAARLSPGDARVNRLVLSGGACALAFGATQWWAWSVLISAQVSLTGNPAGSFFYLLTALHGLHVLGGVAGWVVTLRAMRGGASAAHTHWRIALCARYWHFLLAVWLLLFAAFVFITPEVAGIICGTR